MPEELTVAEVRRHASTSNFSAVFCDGHPDELVMSWVHTRGRLEKGGGDSGKDMVMMKKGGFPNVVVSGAAGLSGAVFSTRGKYFCFQTSNSLFLGETKDFSTSCWLKLQPGESFTGNPMWVRDEKVLFGVRGGEPKLDNLFSVPLLIDVSKKEKVVRKGPIFTAENGGSLMGWDHSQKDGDGNVAVVHRLANAMFAEIVLVSEEGGSTPNTLAIDCRVEYCRPQVGFLSSGALLLRLNALVGGTPSHLRDSSKVKTLSLDEQKRAVHGLWVMENFGSDGMLTPVNVEVGSDAKHGTYDVCTSSYGPLGASEGFKLDPGRNRIVVTARPTNITDNISYSDNLVLLDFSEKDGTISFDQKAVDTTDDGLMDGCKIPVAVSATEVVYHFRSPVDSGDLCITDVQPTPGNIKVGTATRLTRTMPLSLRQKLFPLPRQVTIENKNAPFCKDDSPVLPIHALLYKPSPDYDQPVQPLLWVHGGPMAQYSFDYNPLLNWLASCGYLVLAPNVSGSTGNGLQFMNRVLGEGCGVADLSDCLACANWLETEAINHESRLDLSRGVGVAGHSWGGYLAFMCMLQEADGESVFSCGIAAAGVTDWFVQQRYTEVRYYDYALMGGWVYEKEIIDRARAVSPLSKAGDLRAPLLVLHGDKDIDVPFQQIPPFVEAAKRSSHPGASVEYHAYPGEGHGISGSAEVQADYLNRVKTFLRIQLKPWDFTSNPHGDTTTY